MDCHQKLHARFSAIIRERNPRAQNELCSSLRSTSFVFFYFIFFFFFSFLFYALLFFFACVSFDCRWWSCSMSQPNKSAHTLPDNRIHYDWMRTILCVVVYHISSSVIHSIPTFMNLYATNNIGSDVILIYKHPWSINNRVTRRVEEGKKIIPDGPK